MAIETEIKLRTTLEGLQALRQSPTLAALTKTTDWQTKALKNQYFDTSTYALATSAVALRIRQEGDQFIQTLKTRGQSVAGLSVRNEWEWPLTSEQLAVELLDDSGWPQELAGVDKAQLKPMFSTNFTRECVQVSFEFEQQLAVIEVALDKGQVVTAEGQEALCELELELREGPITALFDLAEKLATEAPLIPCDISKAERGYRLLDSRFYQVKLTAPNMAEDSTLDQAIEQWVTYLLGSAQRLAEQYQFNQHWKLLEQWFTHLLQLKALLSSLGLAAPRKTTAQLRQQLDELIRDWQPIIEQGAQDSVVRDEASLQFMDNTRQQSWGNYCLAQAAWVNQQLWQQGRNSKGQRQGQAVFSSWLQHFLKDELLALQVESYLREPQRINEQHSRLERILVWLELARQVLTEVSDKDQLLGVLRHVLHFSQNELTENQHGELIERLIELRRLPAWKTLVR